MFWEILKSFKCNLKLAAAFWDSKGAPFYVFTFRRPRKVLGTKKALENLEKASTLVRCRLFACAVCARTEEVR